MENYKELEERIRILETKGYVMNGFMEEVKSEFHTINKKLDTLLEHKVASSVEQEGLERRVSSLEKNQKWFIGTVILLLGGFLIDIVKIIIRKL